MKSKQIRVLGNISLGAHYRLMYVALIKNIIVAYHLERKYYVLHYNTLQYIVLDYRDDILTIIKLFIEHIININIKDIILYFLTRHVLWLRV